jgi:hypothetical protein
VIVTWVAPKGVLRKGRVGVYLHMHKRTTPKTFARAKELHRNMTPAEVKLWARLRAHRLEGVHFRNQHAIGKYIVDFCASTKGSLIFSQLQHAQPNIDQSGMEKEHGNSAEKVKICGRKVI